MRTFVMGLTATLLAATFLAGPASAADPVPAAPPVADPAAPAPPVADPAAPAPAPAPPDPVPPAPAAPTAPPVAAPTAPGQSSARELQTPAEAPRSNRHPGQNGDLTVKQHEIAAAAWKYFENNYQPSTCLYNAVDQYPSTTMWDVGSSIAGLISAYELGLMSNPADFDQRLTCMLGSLYRMKLFDDELPNKAYNTVDLTPVDYGNNPAEIGASAIDLGRLMTWLAIVKERYPAHADEADRVVLRWNFCNLVDRGGNLFGAAKEGETIRYLQEGRLGYEEYAANGFQIWGFDTRGASDMEPYAEIGIYGVPIAYDARDPKQFGAHNYVVTEAFLLGGLETNWDKIDDTNPSDGWSSDKDAVRLAKRVYKVQELRYKKEGILTARTEHQLDEAPYFVYDTIFSDGEKWATISDDGKAWPQFSAVSTKAALGMWILFDTKYTEKLATAMVPMLDPARGLFEGFYEADGRPINTLTANTNGIVLETLLYKVQGKLYRDQGVQSLWDLTPNQEYPGISQCLPSRVKKR